MQKSEKQLYNYFYHFLEQISLEIVSMGLYWRCEDFEINTESDPTFPSLKWRLEYTEYFAENCKVTSDGIVPCNEIPELFNIKDKYSVVYDAGLTKGLIKRMHPDEPFVTKEAFRGKIYIGWEVKFFGSEEEAREFVDKTEYGFVAVYKGLDKINQ